MPTVGALPVAGALRGWKLVGGGGLRPSVTILSNQGKGWHLIVKEGGIMVLLLCHATIIITACIQQSAHGAAEYFLTTKCL